MIKFPDSIKATPWDSAALGIDTYELSVVDRDSLEAIMNVPGHYTVRINPLLSKQLLEEYGFYYCDTLIEPYCTPEKFCGFEDNSVSTDRHVSLESLLEICNDAFSHGRFHRDFNLNHDLANQRYNKWLAQLHAAGKVYGLLYRGSLAGFIAVEDNRLVLHAILESMRGRGMAKYLWTPVCKILFEDGSDEVVSSVSATNMAVVNLYNSLGFRFRNPLDVYHSYIK
jgi:ribosomal protein S18 acetylase RimI-like enzyme